MINWTDTQLKQAKISKRKLTSLVKKFEQCAKLMHELNLNVYGSDGTGYLIHKSCPEHDDKGNANFDAIVANIGFGFDGGGW